MTRHYEAELLEAVYGRLGPVARREGDAHLTECSTCHASFEQLRWVRQVLAAKQPAECPDRKIASGLPP